MTLSSRYIYALSFAIAAVGFLMPFWPLCLVGIVIAALSGRYFFAILMALLLDLGFGQPVGLMRYAVLPFTIFAGMCALVRVFGGAYFLDKTPPDTL